MNQLIVITACRAGAAHTFLAAEELKETAAVLGVGIKVETRGSPGTRTMLIDDDIAKADAVLLAADVHGIDRDSLGNYLAVVT